jgi:uncharacterized protein YodC (DUF2158 family)
MKVGSIVVLKSGGPMMTVRDIAGTAITCIYWNPNLNSFISDKFYADEIVSAELRNTPIYCDSHSALPDAFVPKDHRANQS